MFTNPLEAVDPLDPLPLAASLGWKPLVDWGISSGGLGSLRTVP